jgi:hypothetical protein
MSYPGGEREARMRGYTAVALAAVALGCKQADPAPRDLDTLLHDSYRDYDNPGLLSHDLIALQGFLTGAGKTDLAYDGLEMSDLAPSDIDAIAHPDRDPSLLVGVAVGGVSDFPVADHAAAAIESDQAWNDPTYEKYDRTVILGDPAAFAAGRGRIDTSNAVVKNGPFGVTIPFTLMKDYQWVGGSDGQQAVIARSWVEHSSCSDNGKNCVEESFSREIYFPDPANAGHTIRLTVSWIDLVSEADSILTEDHKIQILIDGIHDIFDAMDAHLAGTTTP